MLERVNNYFIYVSVVIVFTFISFNIQAQEAQDNKLSDRVNSAAQIPETELTNIPTEKLIQEYLKSRYPGYLFLYDDIHKSFEKECKDFNGLRELLNRQDAANKLIEYYQRMDPTNYDLKWGLAKQGSFSFSFLFVEILFSQESILNKLTKSETKTLLAELLRKNKLKILHPEIFSNFGVQCNTYTIAKILQSKGNDNGVFQRLSQTPGISILLENGELINAEVHSIVLQKAQEFLNVY